MSPIPVSKTKIVPPRRREELITRQRLLDMLFEALDKKLTLVSAPAGYGKTSLLIDLAAQSDLPCCWLALDELDREPQRFAAYFIAALAERFPTFGSRSNSVLEGMNSFEQDMERLLVTLVNELYERVKEHFIFVLDDFHLLEGVSSISSFVNRFVQLMDDNCHLVISSRMLATLTDLPLLVAREQVSGLGFSDLAFRADELQALVLQNSGKHISDEEANRLIEESEGWITGLQFSGAGILRKKPASVFEDGAGLFDYLGQQVLDRQPPELREFILRTSLLGEFDAQLCESVLAPFYPEPQNWQNWIRMVTRNNLFALPVGEDGRWLRYHHLFLNFIRQRFEIERPAEVKPILSRLQLAYEKMGEWGRAHQICRQLNDTQALAGLIERAGTSMLQSAHLTIESWLNELPPSMLRTKPGLLSIRGTIAYTKGDLQEGLDLLAKAEKIYRKEKDVPGLILTLIRRGSALRFAGEYEASLRDAEEVIELTKDNDDVQVLYADALRIKGLALYRLGRTNQAVPVLERALELCRLYDKANLPLLLMETGMVYRGVGNFADAQKSYEQALTIWRQEGNLYFQASLLNNLGVFYQFLGEYEKSALAYEEGLLCAQRIHDARLNVLISIGFGDLYAELEDFEMARHNYQHAENALQGMDNRFLIHSLALARANLAFLQRDSALANEIVGEVGDSINSSNSKYEKSLLDLLCGRLYLLDGNCKEALDKFTESENRFSEDGRVAEACAARIWRAAACFQAGDSGAALQILSELTASRGKILHPALVAAHQAHEWLAGLQSAPGVGRAVRDLLSQAERFGGSSIPTIRRQLRRQVRVISSPTPRLVIQAFGQAVVSMDGRPLTLSDWQTQSVRELFFFFLASTKPLTREQVGEALWREMYEPSKLKLRFKNEVYRLRRAVGQDVIQFKDVYYSFNRNLDYEYDVEAFESFLSRAKAAKESGEKMDFYQRAVDLVRGPYLNDLYADWATQDRERLRLAHLDALLALAELYLKQAQPQTAIAICQRMLEIDPGNETAYRISMQASHRQGDRASITRFYQACSEALRQMFNLPPSKETEELYRQLTK